MCVKLHDQRIHFLLSNYMWDERLLLLQFARQYNNTVRHVKVYHFNIETIHDDGSVSNLMRFILFCENCCYLERERKSI